MADDLMGADDTGASPLGGLSALDASPLRAAMKRDQDLRLKQQAFYDQMAQQLQQRRTGPSTSEQLFELSAALARPTTVRGFSGVLNNVMPVLQQQARAKREGMEGRTEALNALQLAQMKAQQGLAGQDVETELSLAKLMAKPAPRRRTALDPKTGKLRDLDTGEVIGVDALPPPPPAIGEVREGFEYLGGDPAAPTSYRKVR